MSNTDLVQVLRFVMYAFAVYRITILLHYDNGPFDVIDWLRAKAGVYEDFEWSPEGDKPVYRSKNNHIGGILICRFCLSFYVTALFMLAWFSHNHTVESIVLFTALWGLVTFMLERSSLKLQ
jgi:hypothetical protein